MGQYHQFMNFDKKEVCGPSGLKKLMEWSYQGNDYIHMVENLLKTTWKGDRVLCVGDYVDDAYYDERFIELFDKIQSENSEYNQFNIYFYPYKEVSSNTDKSISTRYIYNHNTKQYIDIKKQPIQWSGYDKERNEVFGAKIHPLSLLLSCSNGYGGGDYYAENKYDVGLWVNDLGSIELSDTLLDNDYQELKVMFDEYKQNDSNSNILINTIYEKFDRNNLEKLEKVKFSPSLLLTDKEKKTIISKAKEAILTLSKDSIEQEEIEK